MPDGPVDGVSAELWAGENHAMPMSSAARKTTTAATVPTARDRFRGTPRTPVGWRRLVRWDAVVLPVAVGKA